MIQDNSQNLSVRCLNRRNFLQLSGALASAAMTGPIFTMVAPAKLAAAPILVTGENPPDPIETAEDIIFSVCQMCHSRCGIRAKVQQGILLKIDGNPYHPNNRDIDENGIADRIPYDVAPSNVLTELGRVCLKSQAGVQTVYDPYRIQQPLKRVGPRNSGEWETISWSQAFSEIAAKIDELIPDRMAPIDLFRPELGKQANHLAFAPGRSVEKEMSERIWKHAWGTANYGLSHTSICEETRHVANELITWDPQGSKNSKGAGRTEGWQPDILGAKFIMFFGANPLEADFPMVGMARNLMHFKRTGGRYVVVDPRFNNTAAKADAWIPIRPGTDAALAMAMISHIIQSGTDDQGYLENTNQAAAAADDEPTWTDSCYLVGTFTDGDGLPFQRYITAAEAGIAGGAVLNDDYVVQSGGVPSGYTEVEHGELDVMATMPLTVDGILTPIDVRSAYGLLMDSAFSMSVAEYAAICEVPAAQIIELANDFVSHGKKAVAMTYRGPIKHTNGLYNQLAIQHLNTLIGNYDWKGGCTSGAGGWSHKSGIVKLSEVDGDPGHEGIRIDRAKTFYNAAEAGDLFDGYPAARPWFPFATHGNYQEVIPSIQDGYPYDIRVLITYWNAWPYSTPALRRVWEETVADELRLPLLVAISPLIGEVAAWADYILPDSTYLEKFSVPGIPWRVNKGTAFQRPVVGKFDGLVVGDSGGLGNTIPFNAPNDYEPALSGTKSVLDIHIGLAKALGLPGVGVDALRDGDGNPVGDLDNSWDWAQAMLDNIAFNAASVHPTITAEEVLEKGGAFDFQGDEYGPGPKGFGTDHLSYRYGNIIRTFLDPIAQTKDSVTGEYYSGVPQYKPITHSDGAPVDDAEHPYRLITYKTVHHGQARTNINPWLMLMVPENAVEISAQDAQALELETGDEVRLSSASHPEGIVGKAKVTQGLKPGVVAVSHHYGHWEQHSRPAQIDGAAMPFDPSRGAGIQTTQIMRTDGLYSNVSLQEPIGASCAFFDTWVKVSKV